VIDGDKWINICLNVVCGHIGSCNHHLFLFLTEVFKMPDLTLTLFKEYFIIGNSPIPFKSILYIDVEKIYLNRSDEFGILDYALLSESDKEKLIKAFTTWLSKNGE
jgi:hypothetical protein